MGNSLKVGDGLTKDKQLINLNVDSAGAPNTRPHKWAPTTKKELNKYGLAKSSLSYKNNFPYDVNYLADTEAKDRLRSSGNMARNPKAQAIRSQIVLPKDETQFKKIIEDLSDDYNLEEKLQNALQSIEVPKDLKSSILEAIRSQNKIK